MKLNTPRRPTRLALLALALLVAGCNGGGGGSGGASFSLIPASDRVTVARGSTSDPITVSTAAQGNLAGVITFVLAQAPPGISGTFDPPQVPAGMSSQLTIRVSAEVEAGNYSLRIRGLAPGGADRSAELTLTVAEQGSAPPPNTISGTVSFSGANARAAPDAPVATSGYLEVSREPTAPNATEPYLTQGGRHGSAAGFVAGEAIVRLAPGVDLQAATLLRVDGVELQAVRPLALEGVQLYRTPGIGEAETLELVRRLADRPDVLYAQPNYYYSALRAPNDPAFVAQWHYPTINLPEAWDLTTGASSVVVAVVDSGVLFDPTNPGRSHPDIDPGRMLPGYDFISDPAVSNDGSGRDPDPYDPGPGWQTSYHGTHVLGTIGAATDNGIGVAGVDWNARLLPVRVLGPHPAGEPDTVGLTIDIVEGMLWSAGVSISGVPDNPNPAHVINMSLGGRRPCTADPFYQDAINLALSRGSIIVVAAGNENDDARNYSPASCDGVITVGATEFRDHRAPYSNYGPRIDIMAPGGDTLVDRNGDGFPDGVLSLGADDASGRFTYSFLDGTSMVAPHVAGVIALMLARKPGLTANEVLNVLTSTARPLTALACERPAASDCGGGLIDVFAAVQALGDAPFPPPAADIAGTVVVACYPQGADCDQDRSRWVSIASSGTSATFQIGDLAAGQYYVFAYKEVAGGIYYGDIATLVSPPASGLDIRMEFVAGGVAAAATDWVPLVPAIPY